MCDGTFVRCTSTILFHTNGKGSDSWTRSHNFVWAPLADSFEQGSSLCAAASREKMPKESIDGLLTEQKNKWNIEIMELLRLNQPPSLPVNSFEL